MEATASDTCTLEHIVKALLQRKNAGPAPANRIRQAIPRAIQPAAVMLQQLLHEGVERKELWEYFPKGSTAHYWTQPPDIYAWNLIESALRLKDRTEAELLKILHRPEFQRISDPQQFLSGLVAEGKLFTRIKGRAAKYSLQPVDVPAVTAEAWQQLESYLSSGPVTQSFARKLLKPILEGVLEPDEFLKGLVADEKIHCVSIGKKTPLYSLEPPDVRSYASLFTKLVTDFVSKVRQAASKNNLLDRDAFTYSAELLRDAFATQSQLAESIGAKPPSSLCDVQNVTTVDENQLATHILEAMHQLNSRVADGDLVSIPELRMRLVRWSVDKSRFDRAMLSLFRQHRVVLSRISSALITETDRDNYVVDEDGNYYNTVALWRSE